MRRGWLLPAAVGSPDRRLDARVAVERAPAPFCSAAADGAVDGGWPSAAAAAPGVCGAAARLSLLVAQLLLAPPLGAAVREPHLKDAEFYIREIEGRPSLLFTEGQALFYFSSYVIRMFPLNTCFKIKWQNWQLLVLQNY